jgi:phage terminase large subunit GpA-like protein
MTTTETIRFSEAERRIFKAREKITVSQWAARYRQVAKGPSPGPWSNELTPYLVEPMDTFCLPYVRKIFLCFAPQTGKTSVAINSLLWAIDVDPGPALYVMPDEKVAKRIARRQIIPTFRQTPKIAELLGPRADDVTSLFVNFKNGCDFMMAWATSAAALASESIRYLFFDEPGKYPEFSGKEADPFSLGEVRTNTYQYTSKEMYFSTPNLDGDPFDRLLKNEPDEVRRYHARCPFCDTLQIMKFENITWQGVRDHRVVLRKKLARYACVKCGMEWDDHFRNKAVRNGRWKAEKPVERPLAVAFGPFESWYSPFVSLSKAAAAFLRGQEDRAKLMAFVTQHQCQAWKEVIEAKAESEILKHKNETPPGIVPAWAVALTCGIDTQKRGFWFIVRAWAPDLTSHLVQYGYLSTFDDVEALVFQTAFQIEGSQQTIKIWRAAIDTGGGPTDEGDTRTEEVYHFILKMAAKYGPNVINGTKGASRRQFQKVNPPRNITQMPHSRKRIRGALDLRTLDTFELKKLIHHRLTRRAEGKNELGETTPAEAQYFYLHAETGLDYVRQLLAEELRKDRKGRYEWKQTRTDNHLLDCEVMAAACADLSWMPALSMMAGAMKRHVDKARQAEQQQPEPPKPDKPPVLIRRPRRPATSWMNF